MEQVIRSVLFGTLYSLLVSVIFTAIHVERMPECPTEDSVSCVWHADQHGNHQGRSFWTDAYGTVHYL